MSEEAVPGDSPEERKVKEISPFKVIRRGEDTVGPTGNILFADFSPKVLPADAVEEVEEVTVVPKDSSAPEPARSPESHPKTEPETSDDLAPAQGTTTKATSSAAAKDDGKPSQKDS